MTKQPLRTPVKTRSKKPKLGSIAHAVHQDLGITIPIFGVDNMDHPPIDEVEHNGDEEDMPELIDVEQGYSVEAVELGVEAEHDDESLDTVVTRKDYPKGNEHKKKRTSSKKGSGHEKKRAAGPAGSAGVSEEGIASRSVADRMNRDASIAEMTAQELLELIDEIPVPKDSKEVYRRSKKPDKKSLAASDGAKAARSHTDPLVTRTHVRVKKGVAEGAAEDKLHKEILKEHEEDNDREKDRIRRHTASEERFREEKRRRTAWDAENKNDDQFGYLYGSMNEKLDAAEANESGFEDYDGLSLQDRFEWDDHQHSEGNSTSANHIRLSGSSKVQHHDDRDQFERSRPNQHMSSYRSQSSSSSSHQHSFFFSTRWHDV